MATSRKTNSFNSGDAIRSDEMNQNFDEIHSFINSEVLMVDGSQPMDKDLLLPKSTDSTPPNAAATREYVVDELRSVYEVPSTVDLKKEGGGSYVHTGAPKGDVVVLAEIQSLSFSGEKGRVATIPFGFAFQSSPSVAVSAEKSGTASSVVASLHQIGVNEFTVRVERPDGNTLGTTANPTIVNVHWQAIGKRS